MLSRRDALFGLGPGLGSIALSALLADEARASGGLTSPGSPKTPEKPRESADVVTAELKAEPVAADGTQAFTVTLTVAAPWHVYANPVGNDTLTASQTTVEASVGGKKVEVAVEFPKGTVTKDATAGDYRIYEGAVKLTGKAIRPKGDEPLEVRVRVIACKEGTCLLPSVIKLTAK